MQAFRVCDVKERALGNDCPILFESTAVYHEFHRWRIGEVPGLQICGGEEPPHLRMGGPMHAEGAHPPRTGIGHSTDSERRPRFRKAVNIEDDIPRPLAVTRGRAVGEGTQTLRKTDAPLGMLQPGLGRQHNEGSGRGEEAIPLSDPR